jgi:hypothetical protein
MKDGRNEALQEISRKKHVLANRRDPLVKEAIVNMAIEFLALRLIEGI